MTSILIAVTGGSIAHTLRPLPIALRLRQMGARVVFAGRGPYVRFLLERGFPVVPMPMLDYARVCRMMDTERFHPQGLSEYREAVSDQRRYLEDLQPNLVLQDGPDPALPVAAFEEGIEHVNLSNATVLGLAGSQQVVPFRPWVRKRVAGSEAWTRRANYLLVLQRNIRINFPIFRYLAQQGISYDQIPQTALIPDLPELFNARTDIAGKVFIGPLLYEPEVPIPSWWRNLDKERPLVYVGVGTSGGATGMRTMIEALAESEYQVVLSTADAFEAGTLPGNFFAARMVPREAVLRRAAAIVYHGGSATTYQAIQHGVPMVAIPAQFDHDFNARAIVARGLGISIYPHELTAEGLRKAVDDVVQSSRVARNLKKFQLILTQCRAPEKGAGLVLEYANRRKRAPTTGWFPESPVAFETVACDLCGETGNGADREIEDKVLASKQFYSTVRCGNCGLLYCSPRPTRASLWLLEPLEGHRGSAPLGFSRKKAPCGVELRVLRRLARVDLQSRVLVIGCGDGSFAHYLLNRVGCEVLCVEDHPAFVRRARARGLWVKQGMPCDLPAEDSGFDLVLFLDTLERVESPKKALLSVRDRLVPGGHVVIRTSGAAEEQDAMDVPRALYAFTAGTLNAMLGQAGFTEIRHQKERSRIWCSAIPEVR